MKRYILLCFSCVFLFFTNTFAQTYHSKHFIIESPLDLRYVNFIQLNVEAYYENMVRQFFVKDWRKTLKIYYLQKQSDTQQLYNKHGYKGEIGYGQYMSSGPAVYTHRLMNDGGASGWGTSFHEITHHFVQLNYKNSPSWFNEGLATFLGEQTRIVKGQLTVGRPNPWRERKLRDMIENGQKINVKFLVSLSDHKFYNWKPAYHITRNLFYWLHETKQLDDYMKNVQQKGYGLSVLEETTGKSYREINKKLIAFIKINSYPAAYYEDGRRAKDLEQEKKSFERALEIKPDYQPAILELARYFYKKKDYKKCRKQLEKILLDTQSTKYRNAIWLMANSYYVEKDYIKALEYYRKALEYSDYYEYKYELYYWMANCNHYLKDYKTARKLHKKFLDGNWEPDRLSKEVAYAKKYIK